MLIKSHSFFVIRHFYVLTKCPSVYANALFSRFITPQKLKTHEIDADKIWAQQNI